MAPDVEAKGGDVLSLAKSLLSHKNDVEDAQGVLSDPVLWLRLILQTASSPEAGWGVMMIK